MQMVTVRKLREAMGEALRHAMSSPEVEQFCTGIGLAPSNPEQDDIAIHSKRKYVVRRLIGKELPELLRIAEHVLNECAGEEAADGGKAAGELASLVAQARGGGVAGDFKQLIFAADGPKPKFVFTDAINNEIKAIDNAEYSLIYDRPLGDGGLTWRQMNRWWAEREQLTDAPDLDVWNHLVQRLSRSLDNNAERRILDAYVKRSRRLGPDIPALVPQVYLHYDPYPQSRYGTVPAPLTHQRMDFLLLFPGRVRVVIECDGVQHYADDPDPAKPRERPRANPGRYAKMVAEDRFLQLRGYEVYRFGGYELMEGGGAERLLEEFFDALAARHDRLPSPA
ncbi:hypothetical protein [Actinoplanes sp. NPDC026619]|uniref:hypothetical protein n=1 Tax=Actinoplanes sp. NPDC026619 TaxID=3155798 RepID=UPI003401822D